MAKGFYYKKNTYIDWWITWDCWKGFTWGEFRFNSGNAYKAYNIGPLSVRVFLAPRYKLKRRKK